MDPRPVENPIRSYGRFDPTDFSSTGYPFEENADVYLGNMGNELAPERKPISLKYGVYLLAGADDQVLKQYDVLRPMIAFRHDNKFLRKLQHGIKALFRDIQARVEAFCTLNRWRLTKITLSIPAEWSLEFEEVYRGLISEVFMLPLMDIYFITEIEAVTHYVCQQHSDVLFTADLHRQFVLFLDFGGHNAVNLTFTL